MKKNVAGVSLRRRQLLIASAAGAAVPLSGTAFGGSGEPVSALGSAELVLSGRVMSADGRPLAGASIELSSGVLAETDGDGRFMSTMQVHVTAAGRPAPVQYRWRHGDRSGEVAEVRFTPGAAASHRDEAGTWRAAVGIEIV